MLDNFFKTITSPEARKTWVAIAGVLVSLATAGLIPPDIGLWVNAIVAGLTAAGVYLVPNGKRKEIPAPVEPEPMNLTPPKG